MRRSSQRSRRSHSQLWFALWALLLPLALATPARADDSAGTGRATAKHLTSRGRLWISGALSGSWSNDANVDSSVERWRVQGLPALTYFIAEHVGLGITLGGGVSAGQGRILIADAKYTAAGSGESYARTRQDASDVIVGVHGAFDLPLATRLSLLFQPSLAYVQQWLRSSVVPSPEVGNLIYNPSAFRRDYTLGYVRTALSAILLFHVATDVALGFGPELWLDFIVKRNSDARPPEDQLNPSNLPAQPARGTRLQIGLGTMIAIAI
jgi:hypothetical protein